MSNMSYCRFQNTKSDLQDCYDAFIENVLNNSEDDQLSQAEAAAFVELIEIMSNFIGDIETHSETNESPWDIASLKEAFPSLIDQ